MLMPYLYKEVINRKLNNIMNTYIKDQSGRIGIFIDNYSNDLGMQGILRMTFDTGVKYKWNVYKKSYAIKDQNNLDENNVNILFVHLKNDKKKCDINATVKNKIITIKFDFDYHYDNEAVSFVHDVLINWCTKNDVK